MLYMVTWIPSIYPSHVSIYTSTMDPMAYIIDYIPYMKSHHKFHGSKLSKPPTSIYI